MRLGPALSVCGLARVDSRVFSDGEWSEVFWIDAKTNVAKVVEMQGPRKDAKTPLVKEPVCFLDLSADEHLAVAARFLRPLPDITRRFVSLVLNFPPVKGLARCVASVDKENRAAAHVLELCLSFLGERRLFTAPAVAGTVGYVREAFSPVGSVLFGRLGYSLDDGLLTGCPRPRCLTTRGLLAYLGAIIPCGEVA